MQILSLSAPSQKLLLLFLKKNEYYKKKEKWASPQKEQQKSLIESEKDLGLDLKVMTDCRSVGCHAPLRTQELFFCIFCFGNVEWGEDDIFFTSLRAHTHILLVLFFFVPKRELERSEKTKGADRHECSKKTKF